MALFEGSFRSTALEMSTTISVYLPYDNDKYNVDKHPLRTLILLHGLHGNHSEWFRKTNAERYAQAYNVAIICPDGNNSMYADTTYGEKYFEFITSELPKVAHEMFGLPTDREHLYIAGLSMGAYGALKAALAYPDRFSKCGSFSAGTMLGNPRLTAFVGANDKFANNAFAGMVTGAFGPEIVYENPNNIYYLAEQCDRSKMPELLITCGKQDYLYHENVHFKAHLTELGIPFIWKEWEGVHDWKFWDESIKLALDTFF